MASRSPPVASYNSSRTDSSSLSRWAAASNSGPPLTRPSVEEEATTCRKPLPQPLSTITPVGSRAWRPQQHTTTALRRLPTVPREFSTHRRRRRRRRGAAAMWSTPLSSHQSPIQAAATGRPPLRPRHQHRNQFSLRRKRSRLKKDSRGDWGVVPAVYVAVLLLSSSFCCGFTKQDHWRHCPSSKGGHDCLAQRRSVFVVTLGPIDQKIKQGEGEREGGKNLHKKTP